LVKYFAWDTVKNAKLTADRGIGFEDVVFHIERADLLDILEHPNPERYVGERIFVVQREGGKRERTRYAGYAKATFRKDRRLNIRLSSKDLEAIQKRALAERLPYQTLISSRGRCYFFSPAVQLMTRVMADDAVSSTSVLTRKRWPSAEMSYG
jgi:hypothetical protein